MIYGYFDKLDDLKEYIEEILSERPNHPEFIRPYCRMLFDTREYQRVVELLERLEVLGSDEKGLLILSYYNMGKKRKVLELVQEYEESLLSDPSQNIEVIFCFAAEIANELFDKDLAEKYENQVKKFPNGEIIILIRNFVNSCNAEPKKQNDFLQDLYLDYLKLNKPLLIAEQLSIHLDVCEFSSAERFIELSEQILKNRELTNSCYNRLAQAFFTTKNWIKAAELAEKNIAKGVEITRWKLMYAASLQQQGKVGTALKIIGSVKIQRVFV